MSCTVTGWPAAAGAAERQDQRGAQHHARRQPEVAPRAIERDVDVAIRSARSECPRHAPPRSRPAAPRRLDPEAGTDPALVRHSTIWRAGTGAALAHDLGHIEIAECAARIKRLVAALIRARRHTTSGLISAIAARTSWTLCCETCAVPITWLRGPPDTSSVTDRR